MGYCFFCSTSYSLLHQVFNQIDSSRNNPQSPYSLIQHITVKHVMFSLNFLMSLLRMLRHTHSSKIAHLMNCIIYWL